MRRTRCGGVALAAVLSAAAVQGTAAAALDSNSPVAFDPIEGSAYDVPFDPDAPWVLPDGFTQRLVEGEEALDIYPDMPDLPDMNTENETGAQAGRYLYRTHEVRPDPEDLEGYAAGGGALSWIDTWDHDRQGVLTQRGDWEALDGLRWTPWGSMLFAEESIDPLLADPDVQPDPDPATPVNELLTDDPLTGYSGLLYEVFLDRNDPTRVASVQARPAVGSMSHEGIEVGPDGAVYVIDEYRGGSVFKFVPDRRNDLRTGRLHVLAVEEADGTGPGRWVPLPRDTVQVNARAAVQELIDAGEPIATYQRPEDLEIIDGVLHVAVTEGNLGPDGEELFDGWVLAIDLATTQVTSFVEPGVNVPVETDPAEDDPTTGVTGFDNPDNLAEGPDGSLWIVEDNVPSDIWVAGEDRNNDGRADDVEHFASLTDPEAEGTGIYFGRDPRTLYVNLQHSATGADSTWAIVAPGPAVEPVDPIVDVQVLGLNDFHGNIETTGLRINPATGGGSSSDPAAVDAGGAAYLAGHVRQLEEDVENSIVVSAGDLVGASPLLSALFHDEPTIDVMNLIGLDLNAVGNHEFDEGAAELVRLQEGGCHPTDGCLGGEEFAGAEFGFLAANVVDSATGETVFPAYALRDFDGARVAFVGMTLEGTPGLVTPTGVAGLEFRDEAETLNALLPELETRHVDAVVVLLHEGGVQAEGGGINDCNGIAGPVVDIVERMGDEVDLVVSGHTHQAYDCLIGDTVVTSAGSYGRVLTDVDLRIDKQAGEVVQIDTQNLVVTRDVTPAGDVESVLTRYREIADPLANRVIGATTAELTRQADDAGESALGDVIADAQLAATAAPELGGAQIAFMNPGGIRADLDAGDVTYGEAFTVQPFGNNLVTLTLTGAQVETLLEQQFCNPVPTDPEARRVLQVSAGFAYTWDPAAPCGTRVDPGTITLDGEVLDPAGQYRITINSFLADGGDNFGVLTEGTDRLGGVVDVDAFEAHLTASSPIPPTTGGRISITSPNAPA